MEQGDRGDEWRLSKGLNVDRDSCGRPTYAGGVVGRTEDELGGSVVAGADVGHVGLPTDQLLSAAHNRKSHNYYQQQHQLQRDF